MIPLNTHESVYRESGSQSLLQRIETSTLPTEGGTDFAAEIYETSIRHLRALGAEDSLTILEAVQSAIDEAEQRTSRTLRPTVSRTLYYRGWAYLYYLPFPPLQSVASIKYYDPDDTLTTLGASNYEALLSTRGTGKVMFQSDYSFPNINTDRPDPIQIIAVTGWGSAGAIPPLAKTAIKLLAEATYDGTAGARDEAFRILQPLVYRGRP